MIDADVLEGLCRSFRSALSERQPVQARKSLIEAGWLDALADDEEAAVALVFDLQGELNSDVGAVDDVMLHRLGLAAEDELDEIAIAYPVAAHKSLGRRTSHVMFSARSEAKRVVWIPARNLELIEVIQVDSPVPCYPVYGFDPGLGVLGLAMRPEGRSRPLIDLVSGTRWADSLASGRIAIARQMIAGARVLLAMASQYASMREQFGVPIGSFQAVKHRLAETLVAISSAESMVLAALSASNATMAALAKALAARAAATAGKNCLQVFGGIGFSSEHSFHRYFRRGLVLDCLLGDGRAIEREFGSMLRNGAIEDVWSVGLQVLPRLDLSKSDHLMRPP